MSLRLYLDDDCQSKVLIRLLVQAGHDVCIPSDLGVAGVDDPIHLTYAIREDRILITAN